ncbi:hypothetical protein HPB52_024233 [Rhipicephalus sanguineus]|uniref:CCHC-type domain-containing protein n=1 Tax=Rhipicephalus sanguineus TaxID=34632 RepID=A0A9D4TCK2_RHISA|nr:hypothetical protein HPB52_024233 [Rhipicephalus sanguineus]
MARVFELVELCSELRADAASERGAVLALKDQLAETRRENTALHQRAILAESQSCFLSPVPAANDAAPAAFLPAQPDRPAALLPTSGPALPGQPAPRTYAAALTSGLEPPGPSSRTLADGTSAPALPPGLHEHVAFVTPLAPSTTPARDTLRLIKANIDPVEKDIRDSCSATPGFWRQSRRSARRLVARLVERNPQLRLDPSTCKVKTVRERSGTQAMIVEVDPQAFVRILQQTQLSVGWTSIRAVEDLHVPTCKFCAQYGHGRSSCPVRHDATRAVCTRCGTEGHLGTDCAVRMGDPAVTCVECRRAGLEASGHPTGHPQCPLLVDRVSRLRARTNNGGT